MENLFNLLSEVQSFLNMIKSKDGLWHPHSIIETENTKTK